MSKTKGRPSRLPAGFSRARSISFSSSSDDIDSDPDFNFELGMQFALAMSKDSQQTEIPIRTRNQRKKQASKTSIKVPSTHKRIKKANISIIDLDDSDDEYVAFADSKSKNVSKSIQGKIDTFFKSSGLISDDDEPVVAVDIKSNGRKQNIDSSKVCPSFPSVVADANESVVIIDDTNEINSLEDIENYCKETEDLLKNANALLEKFTGSSNNELQSTKSESSEKETGKTEKGLGECPICYDRLSEKQVMSTKCGHLFCKECIRKIADTVKKCPTCRKAVNKKNIIPIYI